jgi:dCMP deaminase
MTSSIKWRNNYLSLAKNISTWSRDPSRKIGAVVVGSKGQILAQGFNGFPRGIDDTEDRLNDRETKYKYVVHAEMNAIFNACLNGTSLDGSTMFVYGLPVCSECAKGIIQVGIKHIVFLVEDDIPPIWTESWDRSRALFEEVGVTYEWVNNSNKV